MDWKTRADFVHAMEKMTEPLESYYSEGSARLRLGPCGAVYNRDIIEMEAFARPLWGFAPLWGGGGQNDTFAHIYCEGLRNGTNPNHPEYWGKIKPCDQRMVEMAPIGLALVMAADKIYDPLSDAEKENVVRWLNQINELDLVDNNWQFFNVLTNLGLKAVGASYNQEKMNHAFARFEKFYLGDGWYRDGLTPNTDYYISFAIHFYSLIYAKVMENEDPARSQLYKDRAMQFARTFIHWFDEDGVSIPFGRSLTYRFAQCSFWGACVFAGLQPFEMGVMKGIIARHMEHWLNCPIFDNAGILTVGYEYPNLNMAEGYNAPGSPYWAFKAFIVLVLPEDHAFWQAEALPMPKREDTAYLKHAFMVIQHHPHNTTALRSGKFPFFNPAQTAEKYAKFAYSTYFGFSVPRSYDTIRKAAPDSMLAFEVDGIIRVRKECSATKIEEGVVWSKWSPAEGITVETTLTPTARGHKRKHVVTVQRECVAYDCGFSIDAEQMEAETETNRVTAQNPHAVSSIASAQGEPMLIDVEPNTNLKYPYTALPAICHILKPGSYVLESEIEAYVKA